jgi:hypothetical protein
MAGRFLRKSACLGRLNYDGQPGTPAAYLDGCKIPAESGQDQMARVKIIVNDAAHRLGYPILLLMTAVL